MVKFRLLKGNEINVRVQSCNYYEGSGKCQAIYLLYKDARCDMNILDESVGAENWQRNHEEINGNLFCNVSINVAQEFDNPVWFTKQDVGIESNTEAEKGQASDSFKRACFNWGIGRELYTAPLIKINLEGNDYYMKNGKAFPTISLDVATINYDENRNIVRLILTDQKGNVRFDYNKEIENQKKTIPEEPKKEVITKEVLEQQYNEIRNELAKNGLLLSNEKVANWIKKNAKVDEVEVALLNKNQIIEVNKAMIHLLEQKKAGAKNESN